jgi:leader peptidase (prepilin peptidase) / N-methyltransferase
MIGSFLNVVVYRYQTGAKIGNDRSRCMSCGTTLKPMMLIPVLSFLIQNGRCAYCKTKLSLQYPITELLAGVVALAVVWKNSAILVDSSLVSFIQCGLELLFFFLLLAVTVYDWKHKIIPDRFSILLALVAVCHVALSALTQEGSILSSVIASASAAVPLALLWLFSRGRWMGLGDAKLAVSLGLLLGYPVGASIPVLAFWIGTIPAILLLLMRSGITMKSEIPFGPFLALATFALYVYPIDILQLTAIWPDLFR